MQKPLTSTWKSCKSHWKHMGNYSQLIKTLYLTFRISITVEVKIIFGDFLAKAHKTLLSIVEIIWKEIFTPACVLVWEHTFLLYLYLLMDIVVSLLWIHVHQCAFPCRSLGVGSWGPGNIFSATDQNVD